MPKAYSGDLRERVIETVEAGASRREAAERFEVSVSSAAPTGIVTSGPSFALSAAPMTTDAVEVLPAVLLSTSV